MSEKSSTGWNNIEQNEEKGLTTSSKQAVIVTLYVTLHSETGLVHVEFADCYRSKAGLRSQRWYFKFLVL